MLLLHHADSLDPLLDATFKGLQDTAGQREGAGQGDAGRGLRGGC